jgi:hypothetical protein
MLAKFADIAKAALLLQAQGGLAEALATLRKGSLWLRECSGTQATIYFDII